MMRSLTKLLVILGTFQLMACSEVGFMNMNSSAAPEAPAQIIDDIPDNTPEETPADPPVVCEPGQVEVIKPVKVLFVVDQSGSNLTGTATDSTPTDPLKEFRLKVMQDFYQQHSGKDHLSWGFISFLGYDAHAFINDGADTSPVFARDPVTISTAVTNFMATPDTGRTPYKSALAMIENLITKDIALSSAQSDYLIAFITDGVPSDYCPGSPAQWLCPGQIRDNLLDQDLNRIIALAPSRIQFGTVYYGPTDADASGRLARMAQMGGGQFVDANSNSEIKLNDVISIPKPICQ